MRQFIVTVLIVLLADVSNRGTALSASASSTDLALSPYSANNEVATTLLDGIRSQVVVGTEDRVLSQEPRAGRLRQVKKGVLFCSASLVSPRCAVTAGHCSSVAYLMEFNIPVVANHFRYASPEDTYVIDRKKSRFVSEGKGLDWAVLRLNPNKKTGLLPGDVQGYFELATESIQPGGDLKLFGYGAAENKFSFSQQLSTGALLTQSLKAPKAGPNDGFYFEHDADTGSSSSGSPVISVLDDTLVGVHTHGDSDRLINSASDLPSSREWLDAINRCLDDDFELM